MVAGQEYRPDSWSVPGSGMCDVSFELMVVVVALWRGPPLPAQIDKHTYTHSNKSPLVV